MTLTQEQVQELKKQLSQQIQHLPPQQKEAAQKQIDSMSPEALEIMLKQQQTQGPSPKQGPQKTIFRMIVDGDITSTEVDRNKKALAVLDINPISKGHIIIIPKSPVSNAKDLPTTAFSLAKKLSKRIEKKLKAKSVEIQTETKFEETIVNLIPIYDKPLSIHSPRKQAPQEELEKTAELLRPMKKKKTTVIKKKKKTQETEILKLPKRIP